MPERREVKGKTPQPYNNITIRSNNALLPPPFVPFHLMPQQEYSNKEAQAPHKRLQEPLFPTLSRQMPYGQDGLHRAMG